MTELHERFDELAARGRRRGADAVIAAAVAATQDDAEIVAMPMSDGERPSRRRGRSVFAASGIAALLGIATLSISALVGGTGADSPEAAVRQLADAISHEDPLAAIDVLSPVEVRQLRETVDAASRKAEEIELVESAAAPLAGIDLSVEGLELDAEEMAPGFAKVYVRGGRITGAVNSSGLSALVRRAIGDASLEPGEVNLASLGSGAKTPFVVAVQRDGSWYVSAAYTILENLRVSNDGAPAELGAARAAAASLGSDSPEAAARDLLDAVAAKNWQRLIELAPPDELPVYDYREFLLALPSESSDRWTVDEFSASADVRGDTAVVTVRAAVTIEGEDFEPSRVRFSDACPSSVFAAATAGGEQCLSLGNFGFFLPALAGGATDADAGSETITIDAVNRDGRWFVSPVTTVLRAVDRSVAQFDQRWLYMILGLQHELEPEATITLEQPIETTGGLHVYALEGRRGQELIGLFESEDDGWYLDAELYAPDGSRVEDAWGWFQGEAVRLPADGTYKVVVYEFAPGTYTFWSVADAPAEAFEPPYDEFDGTCAATVEGSTECWTSAAPFPESGETVPVVPTTVP